MATEQDKIHNIGRELVALLPKGFYGNVQFNYAGGVFQGGCIRSDFRAQARAEQFENESRPKSSSL